MNEREIDSEAAAADVPVAPPPDVEPPPPEPPASPPPDVEPPPPEPPASPPPAQTAPPAESAPQRPAPDPEPLTPEPPRESRLHAFWNLVWASFLGASAVLALLGIFILLDRERVFDFDDNLAIAFGTMIVLPLILAVRVGFPQRSKGVGQLAGRVLGSFFVGGLLFGLLLLLLALLHDLADLNTRETAVFAIFAGMGLISVSLLRAVRARRKKPATPALIVTPGDRKTAPYLWAGALAAATLGWGISTLMAFVTSDLFEMRGSSGSALVLMIIAGSVAFAASRGFSRERRSSTSYGQRFLLTLFTGAFAALVLGTILLVIGAALQPSDQGASILIAAPALALIAAALVRGRGIGREGRAGRVEGAAIAAVLVGLCVWPQSAWLRYALGSAEGSRTLALEHHRREDFGRAAVFAEAACERGDAQSCVMAAQIYQSGHGVPSSPRRARDLMGGACRSPEECAELTSEVSLPGGREILLARRCELGERSACTQSRRDMLSRRCDGRDAFACRALASLLEETGDRSMNVSSLYQKACAFGDATACQPPR